MALKDLEKGALWAGAALSLLLLLALLPGAWALPRSVGELWGPLANSLWITSATLLFEGAFALPLAIRIHFRAGKGEGLLETLLGGMASAPSVVVGLLGLLLFVKALGLGFSLLSGALTLGLLNLPFAVDLGTGAILAADRGFMEGALALGAPSEEAFRRLVWPGLGTFVLAPALQIAARTMGEAAALYLTSGVADHGGPAGPLASGPTLSLRLFYLMIQGHGGLQGLTGATAFSMILVGFIFELLALTTANKEAPGWTTTRSRSGI